MHYLFLAAFRSVLVASCLFWPEEKHCCLDFQLYNKYYCGLLSQGLDYNSQSYNVQIDCNLLKSHEIIFVLAVCTLKLPITFCQLPQGGFRIPAAYYFPKLTKRFEATKTS